MKNLSFGSSGNNILDSKDMKAELCTRRDRAAIIPKWPQRVNSQRGEPVPLELIGATIVAIGALDLPYLERPEGGGLVIDYRPKECSETRRLILAFTELGMWTSPPPSQEKG